MFSQTQQSYSMLFIDLGRHVSIPLESSSGPLWKKCRSITQNWHVLIVLCNGSAYFQRGPDDDSKGIETCRPRSINNLLYDRCVWLNIVLYFILNSSGLSKSTWLKKESLRTYEPSVNVYQSTSYDIPINFNLLQRHWKYHQSRVIWVPSFYVC